MNEQHTDPLQRELIGVKKLWFSVLFQAVTDLQLTNVRDKQAQKEQANLRADALRWFNNDQLKAIGSFNWICELFEVDPARLRLACLNRNAIHMARELMTRLRKEEMQQRAIARKQLSEENKMFKNRKRERSEETI